MTRLSRMSEREEFELELERERLRRLRWRRWEQGLLTLSFVIALIASGVNSQGLLNALLRWLS
jgi:hypothetical protein